MSRVVETTGNTELWDACMKQNYAEWGGKLTLAQYLRRNRQTHDILLRAGMTLRQFAVVPDGAEPQDEIVGSCQVLSRPLYCGARHITQDHCVAYVFVPREHRRRGHAKRLVDHCVALFSNADDQVSLWSDVGAYYERSGLEFAPQLNAAVPLHATIVCRQPAPASECEWEWLGIADMGSIASEHARLVSRALDLRRIEARGAAQFGTVLPSEALYKQLQMQSVLDQQMLGGAVPTRFGARTPNGHGWAAWTYMFGFRMLLILGISGSADEVAMLLAAAADAAADYDGLEVKLFESQLADKELEVAEVVAALEARGLDFDYVQRTKTLPMSVGDMIYAFPGGHGVF